VSSLRALGAGFDPEVVAAIDELLARKAVTRELGTAPLPPPIGALIDAEFSLAHEFWASEPWRPEAATIDEANGFLRRWTRR
jgi:uncharacterized protein